MEIAPVAGFAAAPSDDVHVTPFGETMLRFFVTLDALSPSATIDSGSLEIISIALI